MKGKYRNTSFLVELLVNILVFSISCAILVGLFGKAGEVDRKTIEQGSATGEIYAMFQTLKAQGAGAFDQSAQSPEGLVVYYDDEWQPQEDGSGYRIVLTIIPEAQDGGVLYRAQAVARDKEDREICRMQTACYQPEGGATA